MKFFFVQLPLVDHAQSYIQGNIEYAPATLAAYIKRRIGADVAVEFLPFIISNFASNAVILHYIESLNPEVICFSNYLWNLERHLHLAKMLKSSLPHVCIIFGGPEIADGSYVFYESHPYVDYFFNGEGEWFFRNFLKGSLAKHDSSASNDNFLIIQPADELISIGDLIEPFTSGYLNAMPDGSIFLEMTRGCPYRCEYCYYSKNSFTVREQPLDVLLSAFQTHFRGLQEIYLLSPTFNRSPGFQDTLRTIRAHNPGIRLHTEMRADGIDKKTARSIRQAGFASLEIGLQTLTREALAAVNRRADPEKELEGMQHLRDAGIELKIGIIPGLPGDTPAGFMKTVETLVARGFSDYVELYPLMILPGTRMREIALARQASFMHKPPYYFLEGWGFRYADLASIFRATEEMTGFTADVAYLPDFSLPEEGFLTAALYIDCSKFPHWHNLNITRHIETSVFTIYLNWGSSSPNVQQIGDFIAHLPLQDQLYSIVIFSDRLIDNAALFAMHHHEADSFHARAQGFYDSSASSHFRFFQVFEDFSAYTTARDSYSMIVPIIKIQHENLHIIDFLSDEEDRVLINKGVFGSIRRQLLQNFTDAVECVGFESADEMEEFYRAVKKEYVRVAGLKITHVR